MRSHARARATTAQYNALGQRTRSKDPDQGTSQFGYDAFGELRSQTDARGVVTTVTQRDALGRPMQQQQVPPSPVPAGFYANEILQDNWSYDPANGIGEVSVTSRGYCCSLPCRWPYHEGNRRALRQALPYDEPHRAIGEE
ncbi:MAG TPA: RHS repeat domain-containing protein [Rudaea sp.]|nr:RHS repeat domain-containing protein [Rudaea sp.]